jgi:hypothetical protein
MKTKEQIEDWLTNAQKECDKLNKQDKYDLTKQTRQ